MRRYPDLPAAHQSVPRSVSTGNINTAERLHLSFIVRLLVQYNLSVPDLQATFINTCTLYRQRTFTNFMQVIALNTINLPVYGHPVVHNNTGTGPGTSVRGCYCVIITERQGTRPRETESLRLI